MSVSGNKMTFLLTYFLKRVVILYVILYAGINVLVDVREEIKGAGIRTLNRIRPGKIDYLVDHYNGSKEFDPLISEHYKHYYKNVSLYYLDRADVQGLLGYLYYQTGEEEKAIESYNKAIKINRHFFYFHYNLGLIHYRSGRYEEALENFKSATAKQPQLAALFISSSKRVYLPIAIERGFNTQGKIINHIKQGFHDAHIMQVLSAHHIRDYNEMITAAVGAQQTNLDKNGEFYYYAGLASFYLKEYTYAMYFLQTAVKKDPQNGEVFELLAMAMSKLGKEEVARQALSKSIILGKKDKFLSADKDIRIELY